MIKRLVDLFRERSYQWWLAFSAFIFLVSLIIGIFPPESIKQLLEAQLEALREMAGLYSPFSFGTFLFILFKNALSLLASFVLAPLLLIVPLISLFTNGWLLGFIAVLTAAEKGLLFVLLGILPHGLFELPAFFIGEAAALDFGYAVLAAVVKPETRPGLGEKAKRNILRLLIALALLVPAAIVETFITPLFII